MPHLHLPARENFHAHVTWLSGVSVFIEPPQPQPLPPAAVDGPSKAYLCRVLLLPRAGRRHSRVWTRPSGVRPPRGVFDDLRKSNRRKRYCMVNDSVWSSRSIRSQTIPSRNKIVSSPGIRRLFAGANGQEFGSHPSATSQSQMFYLPVSNLPPENTPMCFRLLHSAPAREFLEYTWSFIRKT